MLEFACPQADQLRASAFYERGCLKLWARGLVLQLILEPPLDERGRLICW
jgi:hypothetical protein